MNTTPKISVIVRTKNEERWITHCLQAVFAQTHKHLEVILVDNESTDKTVEKAKQFPIASVVTCTDYRPGKALNLGIQASKGEFIACLSGHCIPVNERWLEHLLKNFDDEHGNRDHRIAGVYGRQEPMIFTSDADKRDLTLLFGLDHKVQKKDSFFHNANSMISRDIWKVFPFDETVTNIEDRAWAQQVLSRRSPAHVIVYEPEASVYHHHGIHHDGDEERCAKVMRVLENLGTPYRAKALDLEQLNTVAVIPVRGEFQRLNGKPIFAYTIEHALECSSIKRVVVSTDNPAIAKLAEEMGAEAPFLRDPKLSEAHVDILQVLRYSLEQIEGLQILPDLIVSMEVTFPFRPEGLLDDMIAQVVHGGLDSVIAVRRENRAIWKERDHHIVQLDEGLVPRQFKDPAFVELRGLGCVTHPQFIRQGSLLGEKIGMYEVNNPYSHLEVRSDDDCQMASLLIPAWFQAKQPVR